MLEFEAEIGFDECHQRCNLGVALRVSTEPVPELHELPRQQAGMLHAPASYGIIESYAGHKEVQVITIGVLLQLGEFVVEYLEVEGVVWVTLQAHRQSLL